MKLDTLLFIGSQEIIIIAIIILLLFGGRKIPELMRGLGSGIKEFKQASKEDSPVEPTSEKDTKE
jgi:sec-independent protein translocase protein TatA